MTRPFTTDQVSALLGITDRAVRVMSERGDIQLLNPGTNKHFYRADDVIRLLPKLRSHQ